MGKSILRGLAAAVAFLFIAAGGLAAERMTAKEFSGRIEDVLDSYGMSVDVTTDTEDLFAYRVEDLTEVYAGFDDSGRLCSLLIDSDPDQEDPCSGFIAVVRANIMALDPSLDEDKAERILSALNLVEGEPFSEESWDYTCNNVLYKVTPTEECVSFMALYGQ